MAYQYQIVATLIIVSLVVLLSNQAVVRHVYSYNSNFGDAAADAAVNTNKGNQRGNSQYNEQPKQHQPPQVQKNDIFVSNAKPSINNESADIDNKENLETTRNHKAKRKGFYNNGTCLTQGEPDVPSDWKRRAPHFVLLGAMKAGTETLMYFLRQHEQIVKPRDKEADFLDDERFDDRFTTPDGILRKSGRDSYATYMRMEGLLHSKEDIKMNASIVASDNTPHYIVWNDIVPARLFCIAPWVKLLLLLRDPVDRCFSHYTMSLNTRIRKGLETSDFETWIIKDLRRMRDSGLIPRNMKWKSQEEYDAFAGSAQEQEAWRTYTGQDTGKPNHGAVVGRSLYSIQLRNWLRVMDKVGKPRSDLLVLRSEEMRTNPDGVVDRVLDFINLPRSTVPPNTQEQHHGRYKSSLSNETRHMLQDFFKPYNKHLYEMLGKEWDGVWDPYSV